MEGEEGLAWRGVVCIGERRFGNEVKPVVRLVVIMSMWSLMIIQSKLNLRNMHGISHVGRLFFARNYKTVGGYM